MSQAENTPVSPTNEEIQRLTNELEQARVQIRVEKRRRIWLTVAVTGLAAIVLTSAVGVALWYQRHRAEEQVRHALVRLQIEQQITASLQQAEQAHNELQKQLADEGGVFKLLNDPAQWHFRIQQSQSSLNRAKMLATDCDDSLTQQLQKRIQKLEQRLHEDETNRQMALRLEQIRMRRANVVDGKFQGGPALMEYLHAFRQFGLEIDKAQLQKIAASIRRSPIRQELQAALDDWASVAHMHGHTKLRDRLLKGSQLIDPDPMRSQLRDPKIWNDKAKLKQLNEKLLKDPQTLSQLSPQTLHLWGSLLSGAGLDAETWLRNAVALHPNDFWMNFTLGTVLSQSKPEEAAAFYRAALAIQPHSTAAWNNLGFVLLNQKDRDEAMYAFRKALSIDPKNARAWRNVGSALQQGNDVKGAISAYQKALDINPSDTLTRQLLEKAKGEAR